LGDLVDEVHLAQGKDQVSWHLENSGKFSVKSLYFKISQGTTVAHFKDMWEDNVSLKIKIFSWQLALDKLPSNLQIATRRGPSLGGCALCGAGGCFTYLFLLLHGTIHLGSDALGCNWRPANFPQFLAILSSFTGFTRRIL
jgi:hypothetical protein